MVIIVVICVLSFTSVRYYLNVWDWCDCGGMCVPSDPPGGDRDTAAPHIHQWTEDEEEIQTFGGSNNINTALICLANIRGLNSVVALISFYRLYTISGENTTSVFNRIKTLKRCWATWRLKQLLCWTRFLPTDMLSPARSGETRHLFKV